MRSIYLITAVICDTVNYLDTMSGMHNNVVD